MSDSVRQDQLSELEEALGGLELRSDQQTLDRYSRDESPFRRRPLAVARVRDPGELALVVGAAARAGVPLTARAGGSGVTGACLGSGLVVDTSALREATPEEDSVWCGAGEVLDELNETLGRDGRGIGPDVISSRWARVGGLLAANACGSRSLRYGRFGDVLAEAEVVLADGQLVRLRPGQVPDALAEPLARLREGLGPELESWPEQPRTPGGYRLPELAECGDALSLLPGSEGTLCVIARARLRSEPLPRDRALAVASFGELGAALSAAPALARGGASAVELLDMRLAALAREAGLDAIAPDAGAALIIEHIGEGAPAAARRACQGLAGKLSAQTLDASDAELAWSLRARALSALGGPLRPLAAFEDPAVAPEGVAGFAAELLELLAGFGFEALLYGHAAAGCLHVRPLCDAADPRLGERLMDASGAVCELVGQWGGALTGEHGWGLSRSHLARRALGDAVYERFAQIKRAFDPAGILNPGVIVGGIDPRPLFDPR